MSATAPPGTPLPRLVVLSRKALENSYEQLRKNTQRYGVEASSDSPSRMEQTELERSPAPGREMRVQLWRRGFRTVQLVTAGAEDHISSSMHRLRGPDVPLFAQTTLTRAACEAAAQVYYLLDPTIGATERMLRYAESIRSSASQQLTSVKKLPSDVPAGKDRMVASCQARVDLVASWLDKAGIDCVAGPKGGHAGLALREGGLSVPAAPKLSALAERAFPNWANWYTMFSATAHSLEWSLGTSAEHRPSPNGDLTLLPDLIELACAAQLQIDAMRLLDETFARFLGHDPKLEAPRYAFRHKALDTAMSDYLAG